MKFLSLQPFVPSGSDFEKSKQLFLALGFNISFEAPGYAGFEKDECRFILQHYDAPEFAQNFMLTVRVENASAFRSFVLEQQLPEKFGIRVGDVKQQPYGKEVNIIDVAGVCWHFVE
ncbi:VOC family protein [Chitinophaga japonensis]|uniref:Glyoxalase/bleomycin resistance protein/dioxygenase superfamily protein n=1 Tax=Chitinophaga japonensis TaxID=104662 RepID=A0A562TFQ5_CHIJA|nr:hypothetical protein [Chitinophaga japonensis]TWI92371.1 hypothetical protein LX66_1758 [Chitinophaga japonensis]